MLVRRLRCRVLRVRHKFPAFPSTPWRDTAARASAAPHSPTSAPGVATQRQHRRHLSSRCMRLEVRGGVRTTTLPAPRSTPAAPATVASSGSAPPLPSPRCSAAPTSARHLTAAPRISFSLALRLELPLQQLGFDSGVCNRGLIQGVEFISCVLCRVCRGCGEADPDTYPRACLPVTHQTCIRHNPAHVHPPYSCACASATPLPMCISHPSVHVHLSHSCACASVTPPHMCICHTPAHASLIYLTFIVTSLHMCFSHIPGTPPPAHHR